jgi:cysteinyl-tRNA synthetase
MKREMTEPKTLHIYDTLSRQLAGVRSSDGESIRIYCCGPTVYRDAHVGNLRTFLLGDLVKRVLEFSGHKVRLVQNITDVGHMSDDFEEDKMLSQSKLEKRDPFAIARDYEAKFHSDLAALNILPADTYPRASECIDLMIEHIKKLIVMDYAYVGDDDSVYFSAAKFASYGELSGNRLDALKPGHRYEYSEGGAKRFHADWALWKAAGNRTEMVWQTPWGKGFPGWHIECSAMSLHYLNRHVDLHIGGIDLRFPHHENERAQSNPLVQDRADSSEAVSLWLHGEHLLFEGRKMSKSAGNVVLVSDVLQRGIDPLAVRFCFLENRYRSQMDLSWSSINAAYSTLQRWREKYQQWRLLGATETDHAKELVEAMLQDFLNDLDTPRAMIKLRSVEKDLSLPDQEKAYIFEMVDELFGLKLLELPERELTEELKKILEQRVLARAAKDFAKSDELRDLLLEKGIEVRDTGMGQSWKWIKF